MTKFRNVNSSTSMTTLQFRILRKSLWQNSILKLNYFDKNAAISVLCKLCNDGVQANTEGMLPGAGQSWPGRPEPSPEPGSVLLDRGQWTQSQPRQRRPSGHSQDIASEFGWHWPQLTVTSTSRQSRAHYRLWSLPFSPIFAVISLHYSQPVWCLLLESDGERS